MCAETLTYAALGAGLKTLASGSPSLAKRLAALTFGVIPGVQQSASSHSPTRWSICEAEMTNITDIREMKARITVFGVGGAGGNAVNNMIAAGACKASTSSSPIPMHRRLPCRRPSVSSRWARG